MVSEPLISFNPCFVYLQMLTNNFEHFVMTPIKCPPPKIVAVTRSLKSKNARKKNIMDDDELCLKDDDFINDDDSLSSFDSKDLIEFERDEPLIDLSEDNVQEKSTGDTVSEKNARNSTTLLTLLNVLESGRATQTTETARDESCAEDDFSEALPFPPKKSSSSSSRAVPTECPGACAGTSGKTDNLSTVFPPLSIQPENPSIVKNRALQSENFFCGVEVTLKAPESDERDVRAGIDEKFIDSTPQNSHQCQSEKSEENFASTSISFSCSNCLTEACTCKPLDKVDSGKSSVDGANKEREIFSFCYFQKFQQQQVEVKSEVDTNNNREAVNNQNSVDESLSLSRVNQESATNDDERFKFLSPHTSQRKFPPKFYSSTSSLNQDCFEASSRLKRLEERFKGFSYTKKLLRSSKLFSKSEEILSSYGKEFKSSDSLNPTIPFPLSTTTLSENCLRQLTDEGEDRKQEIRTSSSENISGEF